MIRIHHPVSRLGGNNKMILSFSMSFSDFSIHVILSFILLAFALNIDHIVHLTLWDVPIITRL